MSQSRPIAASGAHAGNTAIAATRFAAMVLLLAI